MFVELPTPTMLSFTVQPAGASLPRADQVLIRAELTGRFVLTTCTSFSSRRARKDGVTARSRDAVGSAIHNDGERGAMTAALREPSGTAARSHARRGSLVPNLNLERPGRSPATLLSRPQHRPPTSLHQGNGGFEFSFQVR